MKRTLVAVVVTGLLALTSYVVGAHSTPPQQSAAQTDDAQWVTVIQDGKPVWVELVPVVATPTAAPSATATRTPAPTATAGSTATETELPTPTPIWPSTATAAVQPTPTQIPSLTPTIVGYPITPASGVVRNGLTGNLRIRDCDSVVVIGVSCPQYQVNGLAQVMVPGQLMVMYALAWPYNNDQEVWARIAPKDDLWIALCINGTAYAGRYDVPSIEEWNYEASIHKLGEPISCFYPVG